MSESTFPSGVDRRRFLRLTAGAAAAAGMVPGTFAPAGLGAQERPGSVGGAQDRPPPIPLGNGEPPAYAFQAYPGGNGALLERLWKESGTSPFERHVIDIEPWAGPVPTLEEDIAFLPVHRLAALIRGRHILPSELTEIYLDRLKRYDPVLLCVVNFLEGRAREEAQQADAEIKAWQWKGPLHGIPYGVKDLFSVSGAPTAWGAEPYKDQVIEEDAEVVRRLRQAGAILIAKLSTGEFAMGDSWYRGRTKNPWNVEQGSSGSSAGPASATAAGCVAFGIGTETQGSITSPARRCGLSALRPTFGRITRHGGMVLSWTMDKPGPLCRTIEDCALVFNEIHGADEKDPSTLTTPFQFQRDIDLSTLRIGYDDGAPEAFLDSLRGLGADPEPMPEMPSGSSNALNVESAAAFDFHIAPILEAEAAAPPPEEPEEQEEAGRRRSRGRFRSGRETLAMDYVQSQRRRHILMREMAEVMGGFDMFVSRSGHVGLTNQTGHPAVVVPYDFGGDNPQPLTTTIIGDLFADDKILSVAHAYQASTGWHLRRPDMSGIG